MTKGGCLDYKIITITNYGQIAIYQLTLEAPRITKMVIKIINHNKLFLKIFLFGHLILNKLDMIMFQNGKMFNTKYRHVVIHMLVFHQNCLKLFQKPEWRTSDS
ncbi:hypothetical protein BpHYR1_007003 [Brachionus plicatilis]|uniref:Uncharacterized protein n=1 Tax=Brachionus plicatilis TaxID=10195 RepID=A0A3M7QVG4_BRAPC|nr:hypothetical protein BpHYR1_007003 [Brachionus plicatilis]